MLLIYAYQSCSLYKMNWYLTESNKSSAVLCVHSMKQSRSKENFCVTSPRHPLSSCPPLFSPLPPRLCPSAPPIDMAFIGNFWTNFLSFRKHEMWCIGMLSADIQFHKIVRTMNLRCLKQQVIRWKGFLPTFKRKIFANIKATDSILQTISFPSSL